MVSIPILGIVKAGYDYLAQENWIGTIDVETSLVGDGKDFIALKVHGDSMSPTLIEDDIVIIKKQDDFENGDIVVAIINGDEATIKKGKKSDAGILLQPLNTDYEPSGTALLRYILSCVDWNYMAHQKSDFDRYTFYLRFVQEDLENTFEHTTTGFKFHNCFTSKNLG